MKKVIINISIIAILAITVCLIELNLCEMSYKKNEEESKETLRVAYELIENENLNDLSDNYAEDNDNNNSNNISENKGIIGVLIIPKLNIEAPIKEGTSQEIMRTSIGHFSESDYWNGNVSLASHNGGTNAHFFEKINMLSVNDEIDYITKLGTKKYKVQEVKQIESTDWSLVVSNEESGTNTITLITCINGKPNYRLCVRGAEI